MRTTLEDLYHGNITPNQQRVTPGSEMEKAESLAKLIRSQHEINSITAAQNFILGFRFGVRLMAECMDEKRR